MPIRDTKDARIAIQQLMIAIHAIGKCRAGLFDDLDMQDVHTGEPMDAEAIAAEAERLLGLLRVAFNNRKATLAACPQWMES